MTRPGNGPYKGAMFDGLVHFTASVDVAEHEAMVEECKKSKLNRTEWVRLAISEKIARDSNGQSTDIRGETTNK